MGHLERDEGNYDRARELYQESLALRREVGDQMALAQSLEDFAVLAGRERQWERATRLLGAGEAFCEILGARPPVGIVPEYERTVAEARAALGPPAPERSRVPDLASSGRANKVPDEAGKAFAAAWAEGRAMSLDEALDYALGEG
jgi:hypothetical protein